MFSTIQDAKRELERAGLHISMRNESFWIADNLEDVGDGLRISRDASSLIKSPDGWTAVFPGTGMSFYDVPGSLEDLVPLIVSVYESYRKEGGAFIDSFPRVDAESDKYLAGSIPASV